MKRQGTVLVLGGGIAGLAAAAELRRRAPTLKVTLVEARDRLGGRVWTERDPVSDEPLELGAEFVHGRPPELLAVLKRARLELSNDGNPPPDPRPRAAGKERPAEEERAPETPFELMPRILAPLLRDDRPDLTVSALLAQTPTLSPDQRAMLRGYVQGFYAAPAQTASARAIAKLEAGAAAVHGYRSAHVLAGYDRLVHWLTRPLDSEQLLLGAVAEQLEWRLGHVRLRARSLAGAPLELEAERAIVALPLEALAGRAPRSSLRFRPALPEKRGAARQLRMGNVLKILLRFRAPLTSESFLFVYGAPISVWWTAAAPRSRWLVGWAGGPTADALDRQGDQRLVRLALASVARGVNQPVATVARQLDGFRIVRWSREPYSLGGYAYVPLGADGAMRALSKPVKGTLFFAGEATHETHAGTVHGAHESGIRAAEELLHS